MAAVRHAWHLVRRFLGSLWPGPPRARDEAWAREHLLPGERLIWARMSNPDRRHAVQVARDVVAELGPDADRPVVAAALLHDSGKVVSGLGTMARVGATVWWGLIDPARAVDWARRPSGVRHRLGAYRRHPELGSELLADAGSDPLTVAWAREHHLPVDRWTVPPRVGLVLKTCDGD